MKYIVFIIVFIGIHTSCFSGCFHAKDGVLIIDSLVKRWKYFEKNEIIDSLKKIGVKMSVGKPYKRGNSAGTTITIEKAILFDSIEIDSIALGWNNFRTDGKRKVTSHSSRFSLSIPYRGDNLEQYISNSFHPYFSLYKMIIERYGSPIIETRKYLHTIPNEEVLTEFKRIRNQDEDKINKDEVNTRWIKHHYVNDNEYVYDISLSISKEYLIGFTCGWAKTLK